MAIKTLHSFLLFPHIGLGFLTIVLFWGAMVTVKGGQRHRKIGRFFCLTMAGCCLFSFLMSLLSFSAPEIVHPGAVPERVYMSATFLTYLGILSLACTLNGWVALKKSFINFRVPLNLLLIIFATINLAMGIWFVDVVFLAMTPIGFIVGIPGFRRHQKGMRAHLGGMIGGGIGVHTAFIAGGGQRFLPSFIHELGWVPWVVPAILGVMAIKFYEKKFPSASESRS